MTAATIANPSIAFNMNRSRSRRSSASEVKRSLSISNDEEDDFEDSHSVTLNKLNNYYRKVKRQILSFQSVTTGLFPNHLEHKSNTGHVLENVFCAISVWSLRQCYLKIDNDQGRTHELGQAAVKCMRGILHCWMRQTQKIEVFKGEQTSKDALHSKFNVLDGNEVDGADEIGQLQICAVSIYLLTLVQMITSNLQIIFSIDEVDFVQQLIFYIERAYRTPDYGIWQRGSKYNTNTCELHASSIGMAKAALEAMNGFNLYGDQGSSRSVVYVDVDAHNRNRTTFDTLLPRESASKNTDAALLFTVGWPSFAIHETALVDNTIRKCIRKLRGEHGFKRFLRDGQYTDLESKNERFYRETDIKKFDKNECEWPMFFALMVINGFFTNDKNQIDEYMKALKPLLRRTTEGEMMPHYYYVDHLNTVEHQRSSPERKTNFSCSSEILNGKFFLFGQSVWIICQLLVDNLLTITDLDPIRRFLPPSDRPKPNSRYSSIQDSSRYQYSSSVSKSFLESSSNPKAKDLRSMVTFSDLTIQIVAISESVRLQQVLATYGIQTQTPKQVEPLLIWPPAELVKVYSNLGKNGKFNFSGRPKRPIGVLGTCKVYRIASQTVLCYPLTFETTDFYMSTDMTLLLDNIRSDLEFITRCWRVKGRPIYVMMLRERHLRGPQKSDLLELLTQIRQGKVSSNVFVRLERLQTAISNACLEHLDFLNELTFPSSDWKSVAVNEQKTTGEVGQYKSLTDITKAPIIGEDIDYFRNEFQNESNANIQEFINNTEVALGSIKQHALATYELWKRARMDFYIREDYQVHDHFQRLITEAGRWQHWTVIRFVSSILHKIVDSLAPAVTNLLVRGKIVTIGIFGFDEIVIDKPIRPNEIFNILYGDNVFGRNIFHAVLLQELLINIALFMSTYPHLFNGILKIRLGWILEAMKIALEQLKTDVDEVASLNVMSPNELKQLLYYVLTTDGQTNPTSGDLEPRSAFQKRQIDGALSRVPANFFENVWSILERTPGGIRLCGIFLPQQPTLSDMTDYELNFSLKIEDMLSRIADPAYRCLVVEMFEAIHVLLKRNSELRFILPLDVDNLLKDAVNLFQEQTGTKQPYSDFYNLPMTLVCGSTGYMIRSIINHLFNSNIQKADVNEPTLEVCQIS